MPKMTILLGPVYEWTVWNIHGNTYGWCNLQIYRLRIPVHLLLVIEGDLLSEIPALIILADDTKPVIDSVVNTFKKYNQVKKQP